jgi:hypothetical protein
VAPLRVRLYTVMPNLETGSGGTAVSGFGYADTAIIFDTASSGATSNTDAVTFPTATGGTWGELVGVDIRENGGTQVWVGAFNVPKILNDGQSFQLPAGTFPLILPAGRVELAHNGGSSAGSRAALHTKRCSGRS